MAKDYGLRLVASTSNGKGDLFNRLVKDLFFALGYEDLRLDVHRPGREIDIQGVHRLEPKRLFAECKAQWEKVGGDQVNKFRGVLAHERKRVARKQGALVGYFVSLSGFTSAVPEQEQELGKLNRLILLDGDQIVQELVRQRILISRENAAEQAGRCAAAAVLEGACIEGSEVLGHELGYMWAVFYARNKDRTHFALIHADGTPLARAAAQAVVEADARAQGSLHSLGYLAPPVAGPDRQALAKAAVERYRHWIGSECGSIQLDGLPADSNLSALRLKLERLFIPLKVVCRESGKLQVEKATAELGEVVVGVGQFLAEHSRFSLLAKPGGGKSTLLKRLALAYALPERRGEASDTLPERDWLPLFVRCRGLGERARRPIREIFDDLSAHASMDKVEAETFGAQVDEALRSGRALLLIDGLDEISEEGTRSAFAQHLRTFLAMFPRVAMVVTSREAGYRHVAGVIAGICEQVRLASFDEADVRQLCESWHVEVVGDSDNVRQDAHALAAMIWENDRIRALAENPLMLTTLLVVRRSIRYLPTKRVELYKEAIKVLIKTWNTEGYGAMDLDEALAQLSYVAISMMNEGIQRIGHRRLLELLRQARKELEAELYLTRTSVEEFVERIEYRSSLLMQTGHERIEGELQPVYEFRHLTFQEYLAARGLIEEQYPGRGEDRTLVELLEPHFEDEGWREVVPLAAVLAGRKAERLVQRLTALCESRKLRFGFPTAEDVNEPRVVILRQCILDEVQVPPPILRPALRQLARHCSEDFSSGSLVKLIRGRFGGLFKEVVEEAYFGAGPGWPEYADAAQELSPESLSQNGEIEWNEDVALRLQQCFEQGSRVEKAKAAFYYMRVAFHLTPHGIPEGKIRSGPRETVAASMRQALHGMLSPDDPPIALAAAWALAWLGITRLPAAPPALGILQALLMLWKESEAARLRGFASWAFGTQPLLDRNKVPLLAWGECDEWFDMEAAKEENLGLLVFAWYRGKPWSDAELTRKIGSWRESLGPTARDLLAKLGEHGRRVSGNEGEPGASR